MIPTDLPHVQVAGDSHPGEVRTHNEDRFCIFPCQLPGTEIPCLLVVVADGVGGHQAGEVAAQLTVDIIKESIARSNSSSAQAEVRAAILAAGQQVSDQSQSEAACAGMGSTVAVAYLVDNHLFTATIGDSRIYQLHNHRLRQLSIDHTWIQEALDRNIITPEQARNHPNAHVIQRAIGNLIPPEPDFRMRLSADETDEQSNANQGRTLISGDMILLCSDGLTDMVEDHEIEYALNSQNPTDAVQGLISLARARGGHDNITLVVFRMPTESLYSAPRRDAKIFRISISIILFVLLSTLLSFIVLLLGFWPW